MKDGESSVTTAAVDPGRIVPSIPSSRDPEDLARYLREAYEAKAAIDFRRVDKKIWALALDLLMDHPTIDAAKSAAEGLARAFPPVTYFQTMADLFARLPPPCDDRDFAAFVDDKNKEVQIVRRAGAQAVLLAFCGAERKLGISLNMIHRWFGELGVHVIYLRDYEKRHNYDLGLQSLAPDMDGTLQALRQIVSDLGVQRIVTYGNSLGVYGALRYGLELQAEAVLNFAGPTNLAPVSESYWYFDHRWVKPGIDLRPLYDKATKVPRVHIVYGELNSLDRAHAVNFVGLPNVTLEMVPGWKSHIVVLHSLFNGRYEQLLRWLADPNRTAGAP